MDIINIFLNAANALFIYQPFMHDQRARVIMQPSSAIQAIVSRYITIFSSLSGAAQFVVCCEYCLSQQEQSITEYIVASDSLFLNQCTE